MSKCDHTAAVFCIICKRVTNTCCGNGVYCSDCESDFCHKCAKHYSIEEDFCPSCSRLVVSDRQVIDYLLDLLHKNRKQAEDEIRATPKLMSPNEPEERCFKCDEEDGSFVFCDGCPRIYHLSCAKLDEGNLPEKWYCKRCRKIKDAPRDKSPQRK
jgi:hypothetical protein